MDGGSRETSQRRVILEELARLNTHPTANEIYELVRKRLPRISLGTVYRNLELLSETGRIRKLETAGTQKRFDGTTANHYHIRCVSCGKVEDLKLPEMISMDDAANSVSNYQILWHTLEFGGLCPNCRNEECVKNEIEGSGIKKIQKRRNY